MTKSCWLRRTHRIAVIGLDESGLLQIQDSNHPRYDRDEPGTGLCLRKIQLPPKGVFPQGPEEDSKPNTRCGQCDFAGCLGVVELSPANVKGPIECRAVHSFAFHSLQKKAPAEVTRKIDWQSQSYRER